MDPHSFPKLDPDPDLHSIKMLDPDPDSHYVDADPKHFPSSKLGLKNWPHDIFYMH
jgi:hypothetical protein